MKSFNQLIALVFLISLSICSATYSRCSGSVADDNYTEACCNRDNVRGGIISEWFRLNTWCDVGDKDKKEADGFSKHYRFTACCTTQAAGLSWTDMLSLPKIPKINPDAIDRFY